MKKKQTVVFDFDGVIHSYTSGWQGESTIPDAPVDGIKEAMITVTVYCNNYDDATCYDVSMAAKELMLSYGFQCKFGPKPIDNTDPAVARWISRYQRIFGSGDELKKLH